MKPPPAWIRSLIPRWREVGAWTKASAIHCNRLARGEEKTSSDKWTNVVYDALAELGESKPSMQIPAFSETHGLTVRELAAWYPPSDMWDDQELWTSLAYFQGAVASPGDSVLRSAVRKISGHVTTAILLAAPHVTHRHLVQMDQRATMADNLKLVEASLDKGTAMTPREISAWTSSPQLYVGLSLSVHQRLPLPEGWWQNGGEPLHHPYVYK